MCPAASRQTGLPTTTLVVNGGLTAILLPQSRELLVQPFRLDKQAVLDGEWWRLVTVALTHDTGFVLHLGFNMYALYIVGPIVELMYGRSLFVGFYLKAALGGARALLHLIVGFFVQAPAYAMPCQVSYYSVACFFSFCLYQPAYLRYPDTALNIADGLPQYVFRCCYQPAVSVNIFAQHKRAAIVGPVAIQFCRYINIYQVAFL